MTFHHRINLDAAKRLDPTESDDIRQRILVNFRKAEARWRSILYQKLVKEGQMDWPLNQRVRMEAIAMQAAARAFAPVVPQLADQLARAAQRGQKTAMRETGWLDKGMPLPQAAITAAIEDLSIILADTSVDIGKAIAASPETSGSKLYRKVVLPELAYAMRSRLNPLATTRVTQAYNDAKLDVYQAAGVTTVQVDPEHHRDSLGRVTAATVRRNISRPPYAIIRTAGDDLVCPDCSELEGQEFTIEEATDLLPVHPHCLLPGTNLSGVIIAVSKAHYAGPAVEIETSQGNKLGSGLKLTSNHPVFTTRGLIGAGSLKEGDQLVRQNRKVNRWSPLSSSLVCVQGQSDNNNIPTLIEDVFKTLSLNGFVTISPSADDFHGEGVRMNGKVHIVFADGELLRNVVAVLDEQKSKISLVTTNALASGGAAQKFFFGGFASSPSVPSLFELSLDTFRGGFDALPFKPLLLGGGSWFDTLGPKHSASRLSGNGKLFGELIDGSAGEISFDEIIKLRRFEYCGPAHDVQSPSGMILADNLLVSNCRCSLIYINPETSEEEEEKGQVYDQDRHHYL